MASLAFLGTGSLSSQWAARSAVPAPPVGGRLGAAARGSLETQQPVVSSVLARLGAAGATVLSAALWRRAAAPGDRRSGRVIVFGRNYETNIKNKKGPAELKKAKITKKHLSVITNLCKEGGTDESINGRLARAIKAAIREGVPKDTCYRRIESFNSSKDAFIDLEIDGSGPQGVAVRVLATTDNTNRTRTDVREAFKEIGMDVGKDGTHSHIFRKEGILKFKDVEEDTIMEASMEAEAEDVVQDEDGGWTVSTLPDNFHSAIEVLEDAGLEPSSSSVEYLHDMETELSEDSTYDMKVLLHYLEEADEVNEVFHNAKLKEGVELNFTNYGIPIKRKRERK